MPFVPTSPTPTSYAPSAPRWTNWAKQVAEELHPDKRAEREQANRVLLSDIWIQTKGTDTEPPSLKPFVPNTVQTQFLDQFLPGWREGDIEADGLREIILKARQFGFSTLISVLIFCRTVNNPDRNAVIIADEAGNTEELFQKYRIMWEMLPPEKKPPTSRNNVRQLYFPHLRSRIKVLTAGMGNPGRSQTIHELHCSEVPHWKKPSVLTGLLQAVPKNGNVFIESTAKGEDTVFCVQYRQAEQRKTLYNARFFPWWQHDEYETAAPADFVRTDEEITLATKYALDKRFGTRRANAKLHWRRRKKAEPGMGPLFAQEYPGDANEAFLVSGSKFLTGWDKSKHVFPAGSIPLQRYWHYFGSYDWGGSSPRCFLLHCVDERGRIKTIDEIYDAGKTDPEQAADVKACLERWNLRPASTPIYADPAMWGKKKDPTTGALIANVYAFQSAGLVMVEAANNRVHGWANVKRYLHDEDTEHDNNGREVRRTPFWQVSSVCHNLIRTQPLLVVDEKNTEDADTSGEDHAWDTARYGLAARPRPVKLPPPEGDTMFKDRRAKRRKKNEWAL